MFREFHLVMIRRIFGPPKERRVEREPRADRLLLREPRGRRGRADLALPAAAAAPRAPRSERRAHAARRKAAWALNKKQS